MLTKGDLEQIRGIVRDESRAVVREDARIIMQEELVPVKKDIAKIRKDVGVMLSMFDREYVELRRRVLANRTAPFSSTGVFRLTLGFFQRKVSRAGADCCILGGGRLLRSAGLCILAEDALGRVCVVGYLRRAGFWDWPAATPAA